VVVHFLHTEQVVGSNPTVTTINMFNYKLVVNEMSPKETLDKAYGNIPKEVGLHVEFDFFRGFRYYWYKLIRKVTR
jgi:hypothetical protein